MPSALSYGCKCPHALLTAAKCQHALILIDVQEGLDDPHLGTRSNPAAERNMARLLVEWRRRGWPIFHIQHMLTEPDSPLRPELPGFRIKRIVAPQGQEPVIQKRVNSAFSGTDLQGRLTEAGIHLLVLAGLTTDHCVSSTARFLRLRSASTRMAGDLGFRVVVVADATAAHEAYSYDGRHYSAQTVHELALSYGCEVPARAGEPERGIRHHPDD